MERRKTNLVVTINGVPTETFDAAIDFTTDPIEFPESIPWAVQFDNWAGVTEEGTPKATILCSNSQFGDYLEYDAESTNVDLTDSASRILYDSIFAPRYMKISYVSGDSEGSFNLVMSK
jgi:hypothetical protein